MRVSEQVQGWVPAPVLPLPWAQVRKVPVPVHGLGLGLGLLSRFVQELVLEQVEQRAE
jgi:hypothetical protein